MFSFITNYFKGKFDAKPIIKPQENQDIEDVLMEEKLKAALDPSNTKMFPIPKKLQGLDIEEPNRDYYNRVMEDLDDRKEKKIIVAMGFRYSAYIKHNYFQSWVGMLLFSLGFNRQLLMEDFTMSRTKSSVIPIYFENTVLFKDESGNIKITDPKLLKRYIKREVEKRLEGLNYDESFKMQFFIAGHGFRFTTKIANEIRNKIDTQDLVPIIADVIAEYKTKYPNVKIEIKVGSCEAATSKENKNLIASGNFINEDREGFIYNRHKIATDIKNIEGDKSLIGKLYSGVSKALKEFGVKENVIDKVKGTYGVAYSNPSLYSMSFFNHEKGGTVIKFKADLKNKHKLDITMMKKESSNDKVLSPPMSPKKEEPIKKKNQKQKAQNSNLNSIAG